MGIKILIDPGHGGVDPGAVKGSKYEKNDVLTASLKLGNLLKGAGHRVDYTRTTDKTVSLASRAAMENRGGYNLFISFHRDSFSNPAANGASVFTYTGYSTRTDGKLARKVVDGMVKAAGFYNRGVKEANYYVLRETRCTAILIECGFISNTSDNEKFDKNLDKICYATAVAVCDIYGGKLSGQTVAPTTPSPSVPAPAPTTNNTQTSRKAKYRVKVNGVQVGAYSRLEGAKSVADSRNGIVYDMEGNRVYPNEVQNSSGADEIRRYAETGTFYPNTMIYFRNAPSVSSDNPVQGNYNVGESVIYDIVVIGKRYNWISWISASTGVRRYMPIRDKVEGSAMWGRAV